VEAIGQPFYRCRIGLDIEIILQGAKEKYPDARPRIISDNGPQFIAKDLKEFIRISGMTQVRTSPFTRNRTGRSSAGTNRSKGSASGQELCCPRTIDILSRFAGVSLDPKFTKADTDDIVAAIRKVYSRV
jgi:transposase InsO family protein